MCIFLGIYCSSDWCSDSSQSTTGKHSQHVMLEHYSGGIMSAMGSQTTSVCIIYSTVCSGTDQGKHQSSASLAFVRGIRRWPVNSSHKGPVTQKCFHSMTSPWASIKSICVRLTWMPPRGKHTEWRRVANYIWCQLSTNHVNNIAAAWIWIFLLQTSGDLYQKQHLPTHNDLISALMVIKI